MRLAETEYRVMKQIWANEGITAKELAEALRVLVGWSKTTTYTVISRCMQKNYIRREDPKFHCYSLNSREQVAEAETDALISNNFDDRPDLLVASLLGRKKLSAAQMAELYALVEKMDDEA